MFSVYASRWQKKSLNVDSSQQSVRLQSFYCFSSFLLHYQHRLCARGSILAYLICLMLTNPNILVLFLTFVFFFQILKSVLLFRAFLMNADLIMISTILLFDREEKMWLTGLVALIRM